MGVQLKIAGIYVNFPFEPYDVQKIYMEKVIECLQKGVNGVLESPTGTGKTLCLLCATLGWLEVRKAQNQANAALRGGSTELGEGSNLRIELENATGVNWGTNYGQIVVPKIIYSSRTHSQLSQVIQELKRSDYKHVKAVIVGSRDQLCLHSEVMKESSSSVKIHLCRAKVSARTCSFYNGVEAAIANPSLKRGSVVDIEDLMKAGTQQNFCPYYLARSLKHEADIIFMPYNYLLDSKARQAHGIELEGNVVIFDEAHNVEKICEDSVSFELRSQDVATCISEVTQLMQLIAYKEKHSDFSDVGGGGGGTSADFTLDELCFLKILFCELEDQLEKIPLTGESDSATFSGTYMFELLAKVELTFERKDVILEFIDKLLQYLNSESSNATMRRGGGLQKFSDMVRVIFSHQKVGQSMSYSMTSCYKVHVALEDSKKNRRNDLWTVAKSSKQPRVLSYWCFNPGIGMLNMMEQKARCILLTSGTLAPLDTFTSELQIPFPVRLENPHIIQKKQLWVGIVSKGPDGTLFNSSFQNRSNRQYISSLGYAIVNFARIVPNGLLVFFPSYSVMTACQKAWEDSNLWQSIANQKMIFMENQAKRDFQMVVRDFYQENNKQKGRGGVFMAVCRGKVSEGLDFADQNGRAVIITGLPFPPWKDAKVVLKMSYLDEQRRQKTDGLIGQEWYRLEASRAVNQAIGRVIRHKDDYGAIILCDSRFENPQFQSQLSSWLKPHIQSFTNFGPALKGVTQFFKQIDGTVNQIAKCSQENVNGGTDELPSTSGHTFLSSQVKVGSISQSSVRKQPSSESEWSDHLSMYTSEASERGEITNGHRPSRSLFSAIESHDERIAVLEKKHLLNESNNSFQVLEHVPSKKKKFNVLTPGVKSNPIAGVVVGEKIRDNEASGTNCAPGTSQKSVEKTSTDLLKTMKLLLSDENFTNFKDAIKAYSKDRDVETLIATLVSIFDTSDSMVHGSLFALRKFVSSDQREKYDAYLNNILSDRSQS